MRNNYIAEDDGRILVHGSLPFCRRIEPQNSTKKLQETLKSPPVTAYAIRLWCLLASIGLHSIARETADAKSDAT